MINFDDFYILFHKLSMLSIVGIVFHVDPEIHTRHRRNSNIDDAAEMCAVPEKL